MPTADNGGGGRSIAYDFTRFAKLLIAAILPPTLEKQASIVQTAAKRAGSVTAL